ncbi:arylsulfatase [Isoptericola sp. BMS4]|uniref:arylsulfatase n=1 Tax=Isoptericola sp. BMS4 TaxID=2527875 RepID=UPI001423504A|nr:arylsulfatase [Isoptericola sp. BMS4]
MTSSEFHGKVRTTVAESTPWWPDRPTRKRPNVLMVILDDTGWSDLGCYGSEIATPHLDSLAAAGARFSGFHVTPLCSPTRASLLSGRNHHAVGMRFLADTDTGFPNSRGSIRPDVRLLPQILREHDYGTYLVGKWHLTPLHEITPAGPFANWPLARGFDRYYGFLDGCTDQYEPELFEDNHQVTTPPREGYHLSEDLADQAVRFLADHTTYRPDSPFFLQLALGATHAPFQAPREYIDKYVDVFSKGWDRTRDDRLARQVEAGLVPPGTTLPERNDGVRAWDDLDDDEQTVATHLQAAFAGFLEHADAQVGRVLAALDELGLADDTIVLALSDNGASREGGPGGDVDTNAPYSGVHRPATEQLPLLESLGTLTGGAHYPEGWAMAGNTPFRQYKQFVDLGGVRSPLVVSWPGAPQRVAGVRDQFVHAVDVAPTILDLLGIPTEPAMAGESVAPALTDGDAATGRETQYWETLGHRAVWHDGWKAVTTHVPGTSYDDDRWRLYDTRQDFSESHDLAEQRPDALRRLQQLWWSEAGRNDVFPLDDRPLRELIATRGPVGLFARSHITLRPGQSHVPYPSAVTGSNRDVDVVGWFVPRDPLPQGVVLSSGNAQGGYVLYLKDGELCFEHGHLQDHVLVTAPLGPAPVVSAGFRLRTGDDGSGLVTLLAGGDEVATARVPRVSSHLSFWGLDVGHAPRSTFSERFTPPFALPDDALERVDVVVHASADDVEEYAESVLAGE